jgi:cytochrome c
MIQRSVGRNYTEESRLLKKVFNNLSQRRNGTVRFARGAAATALHEVVLAMMLILSGCLNRDSGLPPSYRDLAVPKAMLASAAARARGRKLFLTNCALCHGVRGDGEGIRNEGLDPKPLDFTNPGWRSQATPRQIFYAIRNGVRGSAMPRWNAFSDNETWELVAYVLSIAEPQ